MWIILTEAEHSALKIANPTLYARNQLRAKLRKVLDEYRDELELHPGLAPMTLALSKVLEEELEKPTPPPASVLPPFNS